MPDAHAGLIAAVRTIAGVSATMTEMGAMLQIGPEEIAVHIANLVGAAKTLALAAGLTEEQFREAHGHKLMDIGRALTRAGTLECSPAGLARIDQLLASLRDSVLGYIGKPAEPPE